MKLTWSDVIQLIIRYGPEAAARIAAIIQSHPEPTKEAFDAIIALALKPIDDYIREAEERAKLR